MVLFAVVAIHEAFSQYQWYILHRLKHNYIYIPKRCLH